MKTMSPTKWTAIKELKMSIVPKNQLKNQRKFLFKCTLTIRSVYKRTRNFQWSTNIPNWVCFSSRFLSVWRKCILKTRNIHLNWFSLFDWNMKMNQLAQKVYISSIFVGMTQFSDELLKYFVKCSMIQSNGHKEAQKHTIRHQICYANQSIETNFAKISERRSMVPGQTNNGQICFMNFDYLWWDTIVCWR